MERNTKPKFKSHRFIPLVLYSRSAMPIPCLCCHWCMGHWSVQVYFIPGCGSHLHFPLFARCVPYLCLISQLEICNLRSFSEQDAFWQKSMRPKRCAFSDCFCITKDIFCMNLFEGNWYCNSILFYMWTNKNANSRIETLFIGKLGKP